MDRQMPRGATLAVCSALVALWLASCSVTPARGPVASSPLAITPLPALATGTRLVLTATTAPMSPPLATPLPRPGTPCAGGFFCFSTPTPPPGGAPLAVDCSWHGIAKAWDDEDRNGAWDAGEPPLPGVGIYAADQYHVGSGRVAGGQTNASGEAVLDAFLAGCPGEEALVVSVEVPAGYVATTAQLLRVRDVRDEGPFLFGLASQASTTPQPPASPGATLTPTLPPGTSGARATTEALCTFTGGPEPSPGGLWTVAVKVVNGRAMTQVAREDGSLTWDLAHADYGGELEPEHWSRDGRYLYLHRAGGDGGGALFGEGVGLWRLELLTGRVVQLFAPQELSEASFAPSDESLVFTEYGQPALLAVLNLLSGNRRWIRVPADYAQLGEARWSPDEHRVVLAAAGKVPDIADAPVAILMLDVARGMLTTLRSATREVLVPLRWAADGRIILVPWGPHGASGSCWSMDPDTGQLDRILE